MTIKYLYDNEESKQKTTPYLILFKWLINHTYLLSEKSNNKPIPNKTIAQIVLNEFPELKNCPLNMIIGQFLYYIYGSDLIKSENPIKYNIGIVKKPIREIFIRDYTNVYNLEFYRHYNKTNFVDVGQTYNALNKFFKDNNIKKFNKQIDFIKLNNLIDDIIIYCLNRGIPKHYLKYILFYCIDFTNTRDYNIILSRYKQEFKKNKTCALCGTSEKLTVHHIKKVSEFPSLEFNKNNFVVLCDKCHKTLHSK